MRTFTNAKCAIFFSHSQTLSDDWAQPNFVFSCSMLIHSGCESATARQRSWGTTVRGPRRGAPVAPAGPVSHSTLRSLFAPARLSELSAEQPAAAAVPHPLLSLLSASLSGSPASSPRLRTPQDHSGARPLGPTPAKTSISGSSRNLSRWINWDLDQF